MFIGRFDMGMVWSVFSVVRYHLICVHVTKFDMKIYWESLFHRHTTLQPKWIHWSTPHITLKHSLHTYLMLQQNLNSYIQCILFVISYKKKLVKKLLPTGEVYIVCFRKNKYWSHKTGKRRKITWVLSESEQFHQKSGFAPLISTCKASFSLKKL